MSRRTFILGTLLMLALSVCAYWPAVSGRNGLVWHDRGTITGSETTEQAPDIQRIWNWAPDALIVPKTTAATPHYYPVTYSIHWLEFQLWQLAPLGYHLLNFFVHVASAVLIWIALVRLGLNAGAGYFAAILFALHPVNAESVAWITQGSNVISLLLFLAAGLTYLRWAGIDRVAVAGAERGSKFLYGLAMVLFVLAMLARPSAAMLPAVLVLITWWKRGRVMRQDWLAVTPAAVLGIGWGLFTMHLNRTMLGVAGAEWDIPLLSRVFIAGRAPLFYLSKLFLPMDLAFIYQRWDPATTLSAAMPENWVYLALMIGLIAGLLFFSRRIGRGPAAAVIFFVLMLAPVLGMSNFESMRYSFVADHFQYAAAIGIFALIGAGGRLLMKQFDSAEARLRYVNGVGVIVIVGGALGYLTNVQARIYADDETLWRNTLVKNRDCWIANENLAELLIKKEKNPALPEAVGLLTNSVTLNPRNANGYVSLGNVLLAQKKYEESLQAYSTANAIDPENAQTYHDMGVVYFTMGKPSLAEKSFRQAIRHQENFADAWNNLGQVLHLERLDREAIVAFTKAIEYNPKLAIAYFNMGDTYQTLHREQDAADCYRAAIYIDHNFAMAAASLAELLTTCTDTRLRSPLEAVELAERANRITEEKNITFLELLAQVYAEAGRYDDAIRTEQQAMLAADKQGAISATIQIMQQRLDAYALLKASGGKTEP